MKKVDNEQLVSCIMKCFDLAGDGRLTINQRSDMLALGKRLRGSLLNLLTAEFATDLAKVDEANQEIKAVNQRLSDDNEVLNHTVKTINAVTNLVNQLDGLLKFAANFV